MYKRALTGGYGFDVTGNEVVHTISQLEEYQGSVAHQWTKRTDSEERMRSTAHSGDTHPSFQECLGREVSLAEANNINFESSRDISAGPLEDAVDGDRPTMMMDPELERFTQPHVVIVQPRYQHFREPEVRKRTFASWKHPFPPVPLLIMSGFFFLGGLLSHFDL